MVRGTRIAVEFVVDLLAAGWSHDQILNRDPHLAEEDIRACLAYPANSTQTSHNDRNQTACVEWRHHVNMNL